MPTTYISNGRITCYVSSDDPLPAWAWEHVGALAEAVETAEHVLPLERPALRKAKAS